MELSEVTVGEKKVTRVKGIKGIGAANPEESKVLIWVGVRFDEAADDTSAEGAYKELDIKAASATFWIVLHKDNSGDVMSSLGVGGRGKR